MNGHLLDFQPTWYKSMLVLELALLDHESLEALFEWVLLVGNCGQGSLG